MSTEDLVAFVRKNLISVACAAFSLLIGFLIYYRSDMLPDARAVLEQKQKQGELLAANIEDSGQLKEQHAALVAANQTIADRMLHIDQLAENNDASRLASLLDQIESLISDEDILELADGLAPGDSEAIIVFEHTWAKPFRDAIVESGGILTGELRLPGLAVDELLDELAALD